MKAPRLVSRLIALSAPFAIAACAAPPPPVTTLDDRTCSPAPDFSGAHLLELGAKPMTVAFDQATPCWQPSEGKRSAYAVFSLPSDTDPYLVTVTSVPVGQALIAPHLYLLDGFGNKLRDAARDAFAFHGSSLSLTVRVYPNERYLLVASEPDTLGTGGSQLRDGVVVSTYPAGVATITVHTGYELNQSYVYAVNGTITVAAGPIPKVN